MAHSAPGDARLAWVDVAKGLCIVLVVTMHATLGVGEAMDGEGFLHPLVAVAQPFRIPAFFLLSGLFLGRVIDRDWRRFADKRVAHFAYFYLLWLLILSLAKYGTVTQGGGASALGAHLLRSLFEPYSSLWFIYLLAVFSVTMKLARGVPPAWLLLAGALLESLAPLVTGSTLLHEFCARFVYFAAGALLASRVFAFAAWVGRHPLAALAGLAGWAVLDAAVALGLPALARAPGISLALGGMGSLALVAGAVLVDRGGGVLAAGLRACGRRSLAIYLAFVLPMAAARVLLLRTGLVSDVGWASLLVTAVALLVPLALERVLRGTPGRVLFERPARLHLVPRRRFEPAA